MINTAPPASNIVYGREILFWYDKIKFSIQVCHCGAVVKEMIARADQPGSPPSDAVFGFLVPFFFFFLFSLFFNTVFPFGLFSVILTADPADHALGSIYILSLSPEFYFAKGISRVLDLHTGQAYDQKKTIFSCQDMPCLSETAEFFSMLVDIMTSNTQYTTNCTSLRPTPSSNPLAKFKLAFCTSS